MTEEVRNTWVNYFQCKQASQMLKLNNSISNGICAKKEVRKNNIISSLLNVITSYQVFEDEVTFAYSFKVEFEDDASDIDTTVTINAVPYASSDADTVEETLSDLKTLLDVTFETLVFGDTIYVWSYSGTYSTSTTVNSSITTNNTITATNITDDLDTISDIWNCLTSDEVCDIINFTKKYIDTTCGCTS